MMNKTTLFTLSLLTLAMQSTAAEQQSHRLAFSKANNVEVFVDHDANQDWCSTDLAMRFAFTTATTDTAVVNALLPKLGVLLDSQCASAQHIAWQALSSAGKVTATGEAHQATGWQSEPAAAKTAKPAPETEPESKPESKPEPKAAEPVAKPAAEPESKPEPKTAEPVAKPAAEPESKPEPKAAEPVAKPAPESEPKPEPKAAKPIAKPAAEPEPKPEPKAAEPVAKPAPESESKPEPKPEPKAVEPEPAASSSAQQAMVVAGWQPKTGAVATSSDYSYTRLTDDNNCQYLFQDGMNLGSQPYTVTSTAGCDEHGYAQGSGQIEIIRSDGKALYRNQHYFVQGIPFEQEHSLPLVDIDENGHAILLLSQEPDSGYYYLMKASPNYRVTWNLDSNTVYLLTEHEDDFRKANSIQVAVLGALDAYREQFPKSSKYTLYAANDLSQGVIAQQQAHLLYRAYVNRPWRSKTWGFDADRAVNYLFKKEARIAQEKQREQERLARQQQRELNRQAMHAQRQLQTYDRYLDDTQDLEQLIARKTRNITFSRDNTGAYQRLAQGDHRDYRQVVHIAKEKNDEFWLDYPYQAVLHNQEQGEPLTTGWFFVSGQQSLDTDRQDEQGFALTIIEPSQVYACAEQGCQDFFTPLNLTRLEYDDPDWTPEQAEQVIQAAEEANK